MTSPVGDDASDCTVFAGLDEAGYGPLLGPLTIGFSAFRATRRPERGVDWRRLRRAVSREPRDDAARLVVADSKRVFTRNARGSRRLEATALAFLRASGSAARRPSDVLATAPAELAPSDSVLSAHPWYAALPDALPVHVDGKTLDARTTALADELDATGTEVAAAGVVVVPAGALNRSFRTTSNKGATLWSYNSRVVLALFERFGGEGLDLTVDRLGGRARYGRWLSHLVPFSIVRVLSESRADSRYEVTSEGRRMRVRFVQKGDDTSLPVALGSCLAKYARELVMDAFNEHFRGPCPEVRPTAGYVTDARRWLADVERAAPDLLQNRDSLVRTR